VSIRRIFFHLIIGIKLRVGRLVGTNSQIFEFGQFNGSTNTVKIFIFLKMIAMPRYDAVKKRFYNNTESKFDDRSSKHTFKELDVYESVSRKIRRFARCEMESRKRDVEIARRRFRIVVGKCKESVNESMKKWLGLPEEKKENNTLRIDLEGVARRIRSKILFETVSYRRRKTDLRKRLVRIRTRLEMEPITSAFVLWKQITHIKNRRERWSQISHVLSIKSLLLARRDSLVQTRGKYYFASLFHEANSKRKIFRAWLRYMVNY